MSESTNPLRNFVLANPDGLYEPSPNAYSHIAVIPSNARLVFIAGQGGNTPKGNFQMQVRETFAHLQIAIEAAGGRLKDIAKLTVLSVDHTDDKHRILIAEVDNAFGAGLKPTCTIIPVPRLATEHQLVEIEAVGVLSS